MNNRRTMLVVFLACLWLGSFRLEWRYAIPESSFLMRVVLAVLPVGILLIAALAVGAIRIHRRMHRLWFALAGFAVFATVLLIHAFLSNEFNAYVRPDFYCSLALTIIAAMVGYWFAADPRDLDWGLRRIALVLALLSVYGGVARLVGLHEVSPFLVPGWPMRLFILFAFFWYLYGWLSQSRWSVWPLVGLVACAPEVVISFHKPIIFCALVGATFVFFYSLWGTGRTFSILARTVILVAIGTSLFVVADMSTGGRVVGYIRQQGQEKFLHQPGRTKLRSLADAVEKAAGGRFYLWKEGLDRFQTSPLIGVGFGQRIAKKRPVGELKARAVSQSTYVHNGYLDLLLSVGILGTLPILVGLIWWFGLALRRDLAKRRAHFVVPCLAFVVAIMAYNMAGGSRAFFSLNAFTVFFMAVIVRLADDVAIKSSQYNRRYEWLRRVPWQGRIRYAHRRS